MKKKHTPFKRFQNLVPKNLDLKKFKINPTNVIEDTKNKIENFYIRIKKEKEKERTKLEKQKKKDEKKELQKQKKEAQKEKQNKMEVSTSENHSRFIERILIKWQ